ncbi:MAG: AbrB/MazE/SpoVT family DNA-binding domain-containing protein [Proteobacteria bacterium]|jgi:AbrB family looped-hinge helix DNA binding protein|nr:AbrB/MazE/SpoVT family DNA-binding domain-containing protein [Pseudomonadota bacterium]
MPIVKTSSKGQLVVPKEIREALGITPGKKILFRVVGKHAEITPLPDDYIKALRGILKGGRSLAKELLAQRKKDNKIDEKHTF